MVPVTPKTYDLSPIHDSLFSLTLNDSFAGF